MHSAGAICNGRDAVAHGTLGGSAAGPTNGGASGAAESWAPPAGLNGLDLIYTCAVALIFPFNSGAGFGGDPVGCRSTHTAGAEERMQNRELPNSDAQTSADTLRPEAITGRTRVAGTAESLPHHHAAPERSRVGRCSPPRRSLIMRARRDHAVYSKCSFYKRCMRRRAERIRCATPKSTCHTPGRSLCGQHIAAQERKARR